MAQVKRFPKKIALQHNEEIFLTYEELNKKAEDVARGLRALGVKTGHIVPLSMAKSPGLIISILGILKAGAAYAPMDPAHPWARRVAIIEQLDTPVAIADDPSSDSWSEVKPLCKTVGELLGMGARHIQNVSERALQKCKPEDLAVLIFTSGTTGTPKGVMFKNSNLVSYLENGSGIARESWRGRRLNFPSVAFDVSCADIW
jgi:non-ribosomal peptide synthetase component F